MYLKVTTIFLCLLFLGQQCLLAQEPPGEKIKTIKHIVSLQGLGFNSFTDNELRRAVSSLNYEYVILDAPKNPFRLTATFGFSPPLIAKINYGFHLGPKFYWKKKNNWLCLDLQFWRANRNGFHYLSADKWPITYSTTGAYIGFGYCLSGPHGLFFHPQLILAGDRSNRFPSEDIFIDYGLSLGVGYCF